MAPESCQEKGISPGIDREPAEPQEWLAAGLR